MDAVAAAEDVLRLPDDIELARHGCDQRVDEDEDAAEEEGEHRHRRGALADVGLRAREVALHVERGLHEDAHLSGQHRPEARVFLPATLGHRRLVEVEREETAGEGDEDGDEDGDEVEDGGRDLLEHDEVGPHAWDHVQQGRLPEQREEDPDGIFDIRESDAGIKVMAIYNWRSTSKAKFKNFILGDVCPLEDFKGTIEQREQEEQRNSIDNFAKKRLPFVLMGLMILYCTYDRVLTNILLWYTEAYGA